MGNAAIAGPRRTKQAPPASPAVGQGAVSPTHAARQLPPFADDEPTRLDPRRAASAARPAASPSVVTTPAKRGKVHRLRWFILGIAFGAIGAVFARGDSRPTLHDVRVWSAKALRSLERTAPPPAPRVQPATVAPSAKPISKVDAPCPVDPGAGDPCAELLAPFADAAKAPVPTVSIDALPRVKPPVIARHRGHAVTAPAPAPAPVASAPEEQPQDDPPSDDDDSSNDVTTAANDPPPIR